MWHTLCVRQRLQIKETIAMPLLIFVKYSEHLDMLQLSICSNVILGTIKDTATETMRFVLDFHCSSHSSFSQN